MDAALKQVLALLKSRDLKLAALQESGAGYLDSRKTSVAFGNGLLARSVQSADETSPELCDFGEGVRLAALIHHAQERSFLDGERVRLEIPFGIRIATLRRRKQISELRGRTNCDVPAEIRAGGVGGIEGSRIAFIESHNLRDSWSVFDCSPAGHQQAQN